MSLEVSLCIHSHGKLDTTLNFTCLMFQTAICGFSIYVLVDFHKFLLFPRGCLSPVKNKRETDPSKKPTQPKPGANVFTQNPGPWNSWYTMKLRKRGRFNISQNKQTKIKYLNFIMFFMKKNMTDIIRCNSNNKNTCWY